MSSNMRKVLVTRQHQQFVANTELRQECVNGSNLYAFLPALVPQHRGRHVIFTIRHDQRNRRKSIDDLLLRLGTVESLEQLLKNEPGRYHALTRLEGSDECANGRIVCRLIPPQG
jgi:hypothetical protein